MTYPAFLVALVFAAVVGFLWSWVGGELNAAGGRIATFVLMATVVWSFIVAVLGFKMLSLWAGFGRDKPGLVAFGALAVMFLAAMPFQGIYVGFLPESLVMAEEGDGFVVAWTTLTAVWVAGFGWVVAEH